LRKLVDSGVADLEERAFGIAGGDRQEHSGHREYESKGIVLHVN
jgi:hypothetical protein